MSYVYDVTVDSTMTNVYTNGLRETTTYYPAVANALQESYYEVNSVYDRLNRAYYRKLWGGNLNGNQPHNSYTAITAAAALSA